MTRTRWAMVGTGLMLELIGRDFALVDDVQLQVIVSRSAERAQEAAARYGVPEGSGDLGAVLARDDVDVVYVATPHPDHDRVARLALDAGKHVLVEKPATTSADATRALCALAEQRGLFLMEAWWTAFSPTVLDLRRRVEAGEIGEVRHVAASFSVAFRHDPAHRLWDPALGGGSTSAWVAGTEGSIEVPGPFWGPDRLRLRRGPGNDDVVVEEVVHGREGNGYVPMLRAVHEAVVDGRTQHELRTHAESIAVAETMDEVLAQVHAQG